MIEYSTYYITNNDPLANDASKGLSDSFYTLLLSSIRRDFLYRRLVHSILKCTHNDSVKLLTDGDDMSLNDKKSNNPGDSIR